MYDYPTTWLLLEQFLKVRWTPDGVTPVMVLPVGDVEVYNLNKRRFIRMKAVEYVQASREAYPDRWTGVELSAAEYVDKLMSLGCLLVFFMVDKVREWEYEYNVSVTYA